jgi:putative transposase
MARLSRLYVAGMPQIIMQRGNNGALIFVEDADYETYRLHLRDAARDSGVALHAYVLMPDHVHLLITPPDDAAAGKLMQSLGRRYVRWFNDRHFRTGTLWEGRYRSTVIEPAAWLLPVSRYIELNPVRKGLGASAEHYMWSSCRHHLGLAPDPLVTDHAFYWALGNTPFERHIHYRAMLDAGASMGELDAIRYAAQHGWMLGTPAATGQDGMPNRRIEPLSKGRPRKSGRPD